MSGKAYVPGMRHDIFVSYPWVEETFLGGESGWVSGLSDYLLNTIPRYLAGRATLDIWMDRRLPGNASVTAEITAALDGAAILLVVLGRQYQASPWCMDELDHFHSRIDRCDEDIFLVFTDDIPFQERPLAVQSLKGFTFWNNTSDGVCRRLGSPRPRPDDPNHDDFVKAADGLGYRLAQRMNFLREQALNRAGEGVDHDPSRPADREVSGPHGRPYGFAPAAAVRAEPGRNNARQPGVLRVKPPPARARQSLQDRFAVIGALCVIDRRFVVDGDGVLAKQLIGGFNLPKGFSIGDVRGIPGGTEIRWSYDGKTYDARFGPTEGSVLDPDNTPIEKGRLGGRTYAIYDRGSQPPGLRPPHPRRRRGRRIG